MYRYILAIIFIILALNIPSWGQSTTGGLEGYLSDDNGKPVVAANIIVTGTNLQGARGSTSDESGNFRFPALPAGTYQVKINHIGYTGHVIKDVSIRLARTTSLGKISLKESTITLSEVVVTAEPIPVDMTTTLIGTNILRDTFEELPVERNFRAITTLSPQADESFLGDEVNIAGATGMENLYFIDGVNTTDPSFGLTSTQLPYNFIKEVEIKTGGYEAEFRSAQGGIVNVTTHSGGNEFSGQAFGFFTNDNLRADPRLSSIETGVNQFVSQDVGFNLGGPILRDKLWFFGAYNLVNDKKDVDLSGFGFQKDEKTRHIFAGKLTWQAGKQTEMIFSLFGDPSSHNRIGVAGNNPPRSIGNLDAALGRLEDGGINLSLSGRSKVHKNIFLDLMLSRYKYKNVNQPTTEIGWMEPSLRDRQNSIWSGGYGRYTDNRLIRNAGRISSSVFLGSHFLKTGIEIEHNIFDKNDGWRIVNRIREDFYTTNTSSENLKIKHIVPSLFIQDSWLVTRKFRINAGLRWDGQYMYSESELKQTILDQYQPRLGLIYQVGAPGSQKIFASTGRFYEQIPLGFSSGKFRDNASVLVRYDHNPLENPAGGDTTSSFLPLVVGVDGLNGQYYDEIIVGYERLVGGNLKIGLSGIYRNLGEVIEDIFDENGQIIFGNPGKGALSEFPEFTRKYAALRLTVEKTNSRPLDFLFSYVLSRNHGNYSGLFNSERGFLAPNGGRTIDFPDQIPNSTGLLPNDRTHVLKFNGSYRFKSGLALGTSFIWQSGTPLTEYGGSSAGNPWFIFLSERGSAARSPSIWDLNFRLTYNLGRAFKSSVHPRLILDMFHVFSQREAITVEQRRYFGVDAEGNQITENQNYLKPISFQPPFTVRLGFEFGF